MGDHQDVFLRLPVQKTDQDHPFFGREHFQEVDGFVGVHVVDDVGDPLVVQLAQILFNFVLIETFINIGYDIRRQYLVEMTSLFRRHQFKGISQVVVMIII